MYAGSHHYDFHLLPRATSSGHLGLLHLGDESVIWPLNVHFHPPLSTFPSLTATSSVPVGTIQPSRATLGAPLVPRVYFHVSVSASAFCAHHHVLSLSEYNPSPEPLRIASPAFSNLAMRPQLFLPS